MFNRLRIFYDEPDDGAGGGGDPTGDPSAGDTGDTPKMAKFGSQLSPEIREQYKDQLSGDYADKHLNDVWTELMDYKDKAPRSIVIPGKDATAEERKAFLDKMGIPETPDGYERTPEAIKDEDFLKNFRANALKAGLTKTQAKQMFAQFEALTKAGTKIVGDAKSAQAEALKKSEQTFPARLTQALEGNETQADEVQNLATKFHVRMGNKALIEKIQAKGLLYDPDYMIFAANMEKLAGDEQFIEGDPDNPTGGKGKGAFGGKGYSSEFKNRYGK